MRSYKNNTFHGIGEWHVRIAGKPGLNFGANNLIQDNTFYERGYRDSSWQWEVYYHQGRGDVTMVSMSWAGQGNVVRGNQFDSGHDAINVNNDTSGADVYDNVISQCMDNAIEVDSAPGQNIRVWRNSIYDCFSSISLQHWQNGRSGPVYIFRNLIVGGDDPEGRTDDLGGIKGYNGSSAFKLGSGSSYEGQAYLYHNTISIVNSTPGKGHGLNDSGGRFFAHAVGRNNIMHVTGAAISLDADTAVTDHDFDCDNFYGEVNAFIVWGATGGPNGNGRYVNLVDFQMATGQELNGISGNNTQFTTAYHLLSGSPEIDAGCLIAGFNDRGANQFLGSAPDIGAFEYSPFDFQIWLPAILTEGQ